MGSEAAGGGAAEGLVRELYRRFQDDEPLGELVAPDFRTAGSLGPGMVAGSAQDAQGRADEFRGEGYRLVIDTFEEGRGGRVFTQGRWTVHGAAGLYAAVTVVEGGRMTAIHYFDDVDDARRFAGLDAGP